MDLTALNEFLLRGGPALWAIALLSVLTLALCLWRFFELGRLGLWRRGQTEGWISDWDQGRTPVASRPRSPMDRMAAGAFAALSNPRLDMGAAQNETTRIAKAELSELRRGVRALELIAAIAPLIGLLGTVLGMIEAFQALQTSGASADPSVLAGGIWEALLTTAAGMAVAIPASIALVWFEAQVEREQTRMEDAATRIFNLAPSALAAQSDSAAQVA